VAFHYSHVAFAAQCGRLSTAVRMKAFVTGSTGLLGNNLVRLLVERGYDVKALARSRLKRSSSDRTRPSEAPARDSQ